MQRTGHDDGINVVHVEQAAVIVKGLNARNLAFRLVAAAAVNIGHGHEFHAVNPANLPQQIVAAIPHADHADADAVVRPQHGRRRIRQNRGCTQGRLLQKSAPPLVKFGLLSHVSPFCGLTAR